MKLIKYVLLPIIFVAGVYAQSIPLPGPSPYVPPPVPTVISKSNVTLTGGSGGISAGRTYTGVTLGPCTNCLAVVTDGFRDAGNCPLSGMTICGVAATRCAACQQTNTNANTTIISGWTATVTSAGTCTIVTTYCASVDSAEGLGVYAISGLNSSTPVTAGSNSATAPTLNVNTLAGGIVITASWALGQPQPAISWTGVTSDFDMLVDPTSSSQIMDGGSATNVSAASPRTVSGTYSVSCGTLECAAMSFAFR